MKKQIALIILDGWGFSEDETHNAISKAKTPFFDSLWQEYPHSFLEASGLHVGLPDGQIGNSEIGHMTIGAGKVIDTDLVRINKAIETEEFNQNRIFSEMFDFVQENNSALHIMGVIGYGGVHAHQGHLMAFLKLCKKNNLQKVFLHLFTDGRDASPYDSLEAVSEIEEFIKENQIGEIASVTGRYYSMDRDNNWDRLEKFTQILFEDGEQISELSPKEFIQSEHQKGKTDEHLEPTVFANSALKEKDAVFFFNYRSDRARMLSEKILEKKQDLNLFFATLTEYNKNFDCPVAFPPMSIETTLANEISLANLKQAHIAETEKFPHATYFLNGGKEQPHKEEEHILLESRKDVKTHDEAPEMRAEAIVDECINQIEKGTDFIFVNFANPDMVGHTANVPAIVEAVEFVDAQLKRVIEKLNSVNGVAFITADHGNAELNFDSEKNEKHTAHTLNKVPCIVTLKNISLEDGSLKDITPTILNLFDIKKPESMTGENLIKTE